MSQSQNFLQQSIEEGTILEIELKEKKLIMSNTVIQIGTEQVEPQEIKFRYIESRDCYIGSIKVGSFEHFNLDIITNKRSRMISTKTKGIQRGKVISGKFTFKFQESSIENLIKNSQTFLVNQEIDEITGYETIFLGVKNHNNTKRTIKKMEQNERQQIQIRKEKIDNVKEQYNKQLDIEQKSVKFFWDLFNSQQNNKHLETLKEQHKCGKLNNQILLNNHLFKDDELNNLNTWIQEIQVIDNEIQNITETLGSKEVQLELSMYDQIQKIMEKKYQNIINLNRLTLQKKKLVYKILKKLRFSEMSFNTSSTNSLQSDKQRIQENIVQFEEINKNVEKYFQLLNFHFNNEDLLKQIEELKQIKKQQEEQKEALKKTIEDLEQQLTNEKQIGLKSLAQLKKQIEVEKGELQNEVQQLKQELQYQKEQVANQLKLQSQKDDQYENSILQLKKQFDQESIKNEQNKSLQIIQKNQNSDEYVSFHTKSGIKLYQNLKRDNLTVIQLFIKSSSIDKQSYFGFCDQNIDIQDLDRNLIYLDNLPKSVFFLLSLKGNLQIQNPSRKSNLKYGGFQLVHTAVLIYDSISNHLTIFKNYLEIESLIIILPVNEKTVIPFVKQANEEEITLRIV